MASGAYPVQLLHRAGGGGAGQWRNLGAAYAAVTFLRPQGQSLVLYAGPAADAGGPQRIVFVYPILPGDAFERLDGATLSWAEAESRDEFALRRAVPGPVRRPRRRRRRASAYPILPGDAFERLDGATLSWAEAESGDEFALCFVDDAACAAVCGAIAPAVRSPAVDDIAETLAGLRVAREDAPASGGGDIAARLAALSIGRP